MSSGVSFDVVGLNLGEEMKGIVESTVLVEKMKEVIDRFESRREAAFQ